MRKRSAFFKVLMASLAASAVLPSRSQAASTSTPHVYLEQSAPVGASNTLVISRVPVLNAAGAILYDDIQIEFDVSSTGALTLHVGYPIVTASKSLLVSNFLAGKYKMDGNFYNLTGPGATSDGRASWSFVLATGSGGCLQSAGWMTGPISGSPLQNRLTNAKITYGGYAYGLLGDFSCGGGGLPYGWTSGDLIGVTATASGLTMYRYTNNSGVDQSSPLDSASFGLCPATGTC